MPVKVSKNKIERKGDIIMKTTKLGILAIAAIGAGLFGSTVLADDTQTIDGSQATTTPVTGDIQINGTLGADNTDPGANIPEGDDAWINVTIPTDTIFYNTSTDPKIQSPEYTITNNSGRGVGIGIKSFGAKSGVTNDLTGVTNYDLYWTVGTKTNTQLITNGAENYTNSASPQLFTLYGATTAGEKGESVNYTYTGNATATTQRLPQYTLTLSLTSIANQ